MSSDRKMHIITISIHALLAESDLLRVLLICPPRDFYPRSPCGERLVNGDVRSSCFGNFYPRSPCGERLRLYRLSLITLPISIHALLAESDIGYTINFHTKPRFLSTLSLRRATTRTKRIDRNIAFLSTLSLRRATSQQPRGTTRTTYFYPRSPCGERPLSQSSAKSTPEISIHALLAESDEPSNTRRLTNKIISIHALLAESDQT